MIDLAAKLTNKKEARAHFLALRRSIPEDRRNFLDGALFSIASNHSAFLKAEAVLCYYPVRGEPNILPLAEYALQLGKTVAFPISHTDERHLSFHKINSLSELSEGAYRIPEPSKTFPEITDFSSAICIVPALAFNRQGKRLGYGGGYYDRFLSKFNGISMGLAYSDFFVPCFPTDAHDATADIIITENGGYFPYEQ